MSHVFKVLGWLNAIDNCSHLNHEDRQHIRDISRLGLFDVRTESILEKLRKAAYPRSNPLRRAEILLYCAAIGHSRGACPQAARDAKEAVNSYDRDVHRQAVALWILGIMQWEMSQNQQAYRNWAHARKIFKQCRSAFQPPPDKNNWYEDRVWQMEVELVARPEEIASWLNRFESPSLGPRTSPVVKQVREKIRGRAYLNVHALLQDLQEASRWSTGFHETAEIHVEFGLAVYQLGNRHSAIEFLRKAVLNYYTGFGSHHKQVVARCLLGAVEWMQESSQRQAAADWMRCLEEFESLRTQADSYNLLGKKEWYSERCDILRSALLERVEPVTLSDDGDRSRDNPDENSPKSFPSSSSPAKTNLYDELLSKVNWDRAIADTLIEYERKMATTTDRNELIRRAIERLIRNNQ